MFKIIITYLSYSSLLSACPTEIFLDAATAIRIPFESRNLSATTPFRFDKFNETFDENHVARLEEICRTRGLDLFPGQEYLDPANAIKGIELFENDWRKVVQESHYNPELRKALDELLLFYFKNPPEQGGGAYRYLPGLDENVNVLNGHSLNWVFANPIESHIRRVLLNLKNGNVANRELLNFVQSSDDKKRAFLIARARATFIIEAIIEDRLLSP